MANEDGNKIVNLEDLETAFNAITPAKIGAIPENTIIGIEKGGTNASTADGARENIGIYSSYIGDVVGIVNAYPTITTIDALVQYVFDTYLLPKSKAIECCSSWAVTDATDSRCVGANADLGTVYNNLTGGRPKYGILTFERLPHQNRIVVTFTPLVVGSTSISKCPQIYATYGSNDNGWATGKKLNDVSGWHIKGSTRVKGNAETSYRWGDVNITPANIGLGSATNGLVARNSYSGSSQTFGFSYIVDNSLNTTKNGHNMSLIIDNDDLVLYDHTDRVTTWSMKPYNTRIKGAAENGDYRTGDVIITPSNIGAPETIYLSGNDWTSIYNTLNAVTKNRVHNIYVSTNSIPALTKNKLLNNTSLIGTVLTGSSDSAGTYFRFTGRSLTGRYMFNITVTNATSSSFDVTVYQFEGTERT